MVAVFGAAANRDRLVWDNIDKVDFHVGGERRVLVYLAIIGVAIVIVGTCYSVLVINRQQHRERDLAEPSFGAAARPMTRNPIIVLYIVIPILALVLGILAWLAFG